MQYRNNPEKRNKQEKILPVFFVKMGLSKSAIARIYCNIARMNQYANPYATYKRRNNNTA